MHIKNAFLLFPSLLSLPLSPLHKGPNELSAELRQDIRNVPWNM